MSRRLLRLALLVALAGLLVWLPAQGEGPAVFTAVAVISGVYAAGLRRRLRRTSARPGSIRWRAGAFAAGQIALLAALASPLDALSAGLFAAHMAQHLLLVLAAAPLLALSRPTPTMLWAMPRSWRRVLARFWVRPPLTAGRRQLSSPFATGLLSAAALWVWHLPALYQAALSIPALHAAEHLSLLGTAFLFWQAALPAPGRVRRSALSGALAAALMGVQGNILGALLTFSRKAWYPAYAGSSSGA